MSCINNTQTFFNIRGFIERNSFPGFITFITFSLYTISFYFCLYIRGYGSQTNTKRLRWCTTNWTNHEALSLSSFVYFSPCSQYVLESLQLEVQYSMWHL
jgi:hypothetical protein